MIAVGKMRVRTHRIHALSTTLSTSCSFPTGCFIRLKLLHTMRAMYICSFTFDGVHLPTTGTQLLSAENSTIPSALADHLYLCT